jgi:hypothetical protein
MFFLYIIDHLMTNACLHAIHWSFDGHSVEHIVSLLAGNCRDRLQFFAKYFNGKEHMQENNCLKLPQMSNLLWCWNNQQQLEF